MPRATACCAAVLALGLAPRHAEDEVTDFAADDVSEPPPVETSDWGRLVRSRLSPEFLHCDGSDLFRDLIRALGRAVVWEDDAGFAAPRARWEGCPSQDPEVLVWVFRGALAVMAAHGGRLIASVQRPTATPVCNELDRDFAGESRARADEISVDEGIEGDALGFCMPGYFNALAALFRIYLDYNAGRCTEEQREMLEAEMDEEKLTPDFFVDDLHWALSVRFAPLLLLDSSPWPFRLHNITALLAEAAGEPRYDVPGHALPGGCWRQPPRFGSATTTGFWLVPPSPDVNDGEKLKVHVWSVGFHTALALEPASVWRDVLSADGPWDITVESLIAADYCELPGIHTCGARGEFRDVVDRHFVVDGVALNNLNKFPFLPDPEGFAVEFLELLVRGSGADAPADVILCTEPPFLCEVVAGLGLPVFGYVGNPWGAYLRNASQERFYASLQDMVGGEQQRHQFAVVSPYLSALAYWHAGVRVPVVQPLGLYTNAAYAPSKDEVLVTKTIFLQNRMPCALNQFAELWRQEAGGWGEGAMRYLGWLSFVDIRQLEDDSWDNWARHLAAVVMPYDPQQMVFYELYGMGMPIFVPDEGLLPMTLRYGYTNIQDFYFRAPGWEVDPEELAYNWGEGASLWEQRWWASLSDFASSPHLLRWGSIPELLAKLLSADLRAVSAAMRRCSRSRLLWAADFWRTAFVRALV